MSAAARIARLDRHLARAGQIVTLKRRIGKTATFDAVTITAKVLPLFLRGQEQNVAGSGGAIQFAYQIIHSPSEIAAAGWPQTAGGPAWPIAGDIYVLNGSSFTVQPGGPIERDGTDVVRIEAVARGGGA